MNVMEEGERAAALKDTSLRPLRQSVDSVHEGLT